ncbi:MAG TPA: biopolymer transporter ExbD [Bacteroidetes bacterium]|jgi:biopolymer transport protein ExbD|nr:biopolymer transporter ExbD [Bacteroidota bacterium]
MPKLKRKRYGVLIDMTPLVDVAFLLLTFFMLTTQFKPPEEVTIELPSSNSQFKLPESDVITLSLSKDGRIFMGLDSQLLRRRIFGPENELKGSIEVPKDKLADMLVKARTANLKLRTVIKGDKGTEYGVAEDVMDILQKTMITRFNLVTALEKQ